MSRDPSKTESATPKRVKKAREKGNVAKSPELSKTITLLAGFMALYAYIGIIATEMQGIFRHFLQSEEVSDRGHHFFRRHAVEHRACLCQPVSGG